MIKKKEIITIVVILVILIIICAVLLDYYNKPENKLRAQIRKFEKIINKRDTDGLSLTIYYTTPYDRHELYWTKEQLISYVNMHQNDLGEKTIYEEVDSKRLRNIIKILGEIKADNIVLAEEPVGFEGVENARVYYSFKKNEKELLDVIMWSSSENGLPLWNGQWLNIFVNGVEIEANQAFYDVVLTFLPHQQAKQFRDYITGTLPDYYVESA